jgi:hypothetical protein
MSFPLPPRTPWPDDFPEVIVHGEEKARDAHPSYLAAKSGDAAHAFTLAFDFLLDSEIEKIGKICSAENAWLLPISADEASGFNAIPDGMAAMLSMHANIQIEDEGKIVQSNKVAHTHAPGFQRIVTPAEFRGEVIVGRAYFLVDDHAGFGGTIANLRGYVIANGGHVVGCTTLTASPDSKKLAVSKLTLDMIYDRLGDDVDDYWKSRFGHGIDCLTHRESIVVARQHSLIALETILAQATEEVRARGI